MSGEQRWTLCFEKHQSRVKDVVRFRETMATNSVQRINYVVLCLLYCYVKIVHRRGESVMIMRVP